MKFIVKTNVVVSDFLIVDARDARDAERVAGELLDLRLDLLPVTADATVRQSLEVLGPADADARSMTYTCLHCGESAAKDLWGPGRITCPHCKKIAPSAAQQNAADADDSRFPGRS